jgi:ATP-dependent Clp protease protease subunit
MPKKINVKGTVVNNDDKWVYDFIGWDAVSPADVAKEIAEANGEDIEVDINSGGGDVFAGSEIYTALRNYRGNVLISIVGLAASAASVIAMAGKSQITPTGMFMIHNVSGGAQGDYHDMDHTSDVLKVANQSIANAYKEKTGLSDKELLNLMDKETWMSAEEVVKNKFIDEVMFSDQLTNQSKMSFYNGTMVIPHETIDKIRNLINKPQPEKDKAVFLLQKAQANYEFLKLKGEQRHEI